MYCIGVFLVFSIIYIPDIIGYKEASHEVVPKIMIILLTFVHVALIFSVTAQPTPFVNHFISSSFQYTTNYCDTWFYYSLSVIDCQCTTMADYLLLKGCVH